MLEKFVHREIDERFRVKLIGSSSKIRVIKTVEILLLL